MARLALRARLRRTGIGWHDDRDLMGIRAPWWLGFAAHDAATRRSLLLPVPINVIYGWANRIWRKLRDGVQYEQVYEKGYNAGKKCMAEYKSNQYELGYKDGSWTSEQHAKRVAEILTEASPESLAALRGKYLED